MHTKLRNTPRAVLLAIVLFFVMPAGYALAHVCWLYSGQGATNPQPWTNTCFDGADGLFAAGSTAGQQIGHEHRNWHCTNPVAPTDGYGRAFLSFHRQFILDFDNWRVANGYPRLEYWDPFQNAVVPGDDETTTTAFTHCSDANIPNPGDNIRPAGAVCTNCQNLPNVYVGNNLGGFSTLGELGHNLDTGPNMWHGSYHNGVRVLGCDDIGGFLYTSRDPAFWMAHKKLDEIARDWQSLQATDAVIVVDRSGSMDDNCSSTSPPPGESPCAINDAREAARTFANIVLDVRMDGGAPAAQQHRIGLVSFSTGAAAELGLTAANGIVTDNGMDDTPFESALAGISTGGSTSIAAGIREAVAMLGSVADPNPHQAILVLTDGKENVSPCLGGNSPSSCTPAGADGTLTVSEVGDIQIVAVGFGPGAEEANLRDVAERHGGIFVAEANVDDVLSLQKFFVTAFGEIYDAAVSLDPRGTLLAGEQASEPFEIEVAGSDDRISVVLGWERGEGSHIITFEEFPVSFDDIRNQYLGTHGVTFDVGEIIVPSAGANSPTQALESAGSEFDPGPLIARFTADQSRVAMRVGLNGQTSVELTAALAAFDAAGNQIDIVRTVIGPGPTPITTPLEITAAEGNIREVRLQYDGAAFEVIDDLEFDNLVRPPAESDAPLVQITEPQEGATFGDSCFALAGEVEDASPLADVRVAISQPGEPGDSFQIDYDGTPPTFTFGPAGVVCGLEPGENAVTVSAQDIHGNTGEDSVGVTRGTVPTARMNSMTAMQTVGYAPSHARAASSIDSPDALLSVPQAATLQQSSCTMQIELFTPSGELVDRTAVGVEAGQGLRHDFIHVALPYAGETAGTWRGRIVRADANGQACDDQEYFYSVLVKGFGRVDPFVSLPNIVVGQPFHAAFRISESNRPIGGYDAVKAEVTLTHPDGKSETHPLFDDGTNGDKLPDNFIWSAELPNPPQTPGPYHLRGRFLLTKDGSTVVREAEYTIVVEREPEQCAEVITTGDLQAFQWHKPRPGQIVEIDEIACVRNRCATETAYQLSIRDSQGWLKTLDAETGEPIDLPTSFRSEVVEPFGYRCFGTGTTAGDQGGGITLVSMIPEDAQPGDAAEISIEVQAENGTGEPVQANTSIRVFPALDCNNNGVEDAQEIAQGLVTDEDRNGVPDLCDPARLFGFGMAELSLTMRTNTINEGQDIVYTLRIMNMGPEAATGVELTNMLPTGVSFVSAEPEQGTCSEANRVVTCALGSMENGATVDVMITGAAFVSGSLVNMATVSADTSDTVLSNNSASDAQSWLRILLPYVTAMTNNMSLMSQLDGTATPAMHHGTGSRSLVGSDLPPDLNTDTTRTSQQGSYVVRIVEQPDTIAINTMQAWTLHVETAHGTPVEQALITIDGGMPQHGHGLPTAPQVTANLGAGTYQVEGLRFNMAGWWALTFAIDSGSMQDRVTFNLLLE